jgi:hypothetical protein
MLFNRTTRPNSAPGSMPSARYAIASTFALADLNFTGRTIAILGSRKLLLPIPDAMTGNGSLPCAVSDWNKDTAIADVHAEAGRIWQFQAAVHRHRFADKEVSENRLDGTTVGARGYVFAEGRAGLTCDEVIGIRA